MRVLRNAVVGLSAGAVMVAGAWAGIGVAPVGVSVEPGYPDPLREIVAEVSDTSPGERLPDGTFLVGASAVSIAPDPAIWTPDVPEGTCQDADPDPGCLQTFDGRYAKSVREPGVHVRAIAISNGEQEMVLAVQDTVGWFRYYPADICPDCGSAAIADALEAELGIPASNVVIAATHTHASGNTLAEIPEWYYHQVRDATKEAIRQAHTARVPAVIDVGTAPVKKVNKDRRVISRAVPDNEVQWLHATDAAGDTVALLYNVAVHPTVLTSNDTLHSGLGGGATPVFESELGGTAMFFPAGIGDQTVVRSRGIEGLGAIIAEGVLRDMAESPRRLTSNEIAVDMRDVAVPGDNLFLLAARAANVFVRDIMPPAGGGPVAGRWGKDTARPACAGAGELSINTVMGGFRLGDAAIMTVPGEAFASAALVVKDELEGAETVFVLGLANDQLGYIIPANQFDRTAQQGVGLLANSMDTSEYEEVLSLHECFGELLMDELVDAGTALGF